MEGEAENAPLLQGVAKRRVPLVAAGAVIGALLVVLLTLILAWAVSAADVPPLTLPVCAVPAYRDMLAIAPWPANRAQLLTTLAGNLSAGETGVALLYGNTEQLTGDGDTSLIFRQNSNVLYLVGHAEVPGLVLLLDIRFGSSTLFVSPLDEVWEGENLSKEAWSAAAHVNTTADMAQLPAVLAALSKGGTEVLFVLDSVATPANWTGAVDRTRLGRALGVSRSSKTPEELQLMQIVATAASRAHEAVMRALRPQDSEYSAEALYLEQCYSCLLRREGYSGIFASGYSSAILHYTDNSKAPLGPGGMILIDAGGEFAGYDTDITRTLPVSGRFLPQQRLVYEAVLAAQAVGEACCRSGTTFAAMSGNVTASLASSLAGMGFIQSANASLVRFFCPHRYFHTVGLDVHDTIPATRELPLNAVVTIEPGIYFNRVILSDAAFAANPGLVRERVEPLVSGGFGGVRIEDTYAVESGGCRALSSAAKSVGAVERLMAK